MIYATKELTEIFGKEKIINLVKTIGAHDLIFLRNDEEECVKVEIVYCFDSYYVRPIKYKVNRKYIKLL